MTEWKKARRKTEFVKFREPLPIHMWSRSLKKGEWTLGEASGDFAMPGIHVIVQGSGLPFAMEKEEFFQEFKQLEGNSMNEDEDLTYEEAKKKICKHLRKLVDILEKMRIDINDGWWDEITCTDCECAIILTDFEPWNFKKVGPLQHYPIRYIEVGGHKHAIKRD